MCIKVRGLRGGRSEGENVPCSNYPQFRRGRQIFFGIVDQYSFEYVTILLELQIKCEFFPRRNSILFGKEILSFTFEFSLDKFLIHIIWIVIRVFTKND